MQLRFFFLGLLAIVAVSASRHVHRHQWEKNTVTDAHDQGNEKIRCWERVDMRNRTSGYQLTDAVNVMCLYSMTMTNEFIVSGIGEEDQDQHLSMLKIFEEGNEEFQTLTGCLLEGINFSKTKESAITMRCVCRRSACNLPVEFLTFIEYNKSKIPLLN